LLRVAEGEFSEGRSHDRAAQRAGMAIAPAACAARKAATITGTRLATRIVPTSHREPSISTRIS
jgi:phage FluMu gp28-like protein